MYSVVLTTLMGLGTTAVDCCWPRNGHSGYAGGYAVVTEMPMGYGCSPCPPCGCGMPMIAPPAMMGDMGMAMPPAGGNILPPVPYGDGTPPPPPALNETRTNQNQAQFVVRLPADARLLADGTLIPGSGPVRVFVSPPLEPGRDYVYDLVIEVDRNGKTLRDPQTVTFQAGKTANITFTEPRPDSPAPPLAAPVKPATTRIRVRMPDGAALYVEGRPWVGPIVQTPPLDPTRTHYYQLRVEITRDGRRSAATREVAFRAGQELTVDFTSDRLYPANVVKNLR